MAANSEDCRRHALRCVNRRAIGISPAATQKFADFALVWLMLATQLEERAAEPTRRKGAPLNKAHRWGYPVFVSLIAAISKQVAPKTR